MVLSRFVDIILTCAKIVYSHNTEATTRHVIGYSCQHLWCETCKDGNQFHIEPNIQVLNTEVLQAGADDLEGAGHHFISHRN